MSIERAAGRTLATLPQAPSLPLPSLAAARGRHRAKPRGRRRRRGLLSLSLDGGAAGRRGWHGRRFCAGGDDARSWREVSGGVEARLDSCWRVPTPARPWPGVAVAGPDTGQRA
jgi:hypothetical protein